MVAERPRKGKGRWTAMYMIVVPLPETQHHGASLLSSELIIRVYRDSSNATQERWTRATCRCYSRIHSLYTYALLYVARPLKYGVRGLRCIGNSFVLPRNGPGALRPSRKRRSIARLVDHKYGSAQGHSADAARSEMKYPRPRDCG